MMGKQSKSETIKLRVTPNTRWRLGRLGKGNASNYIRQLIRQALVDELIKEGGMEKASSLAYLEFDGAIEYYYKNHCDKLEAKDGKKTTDTETTTGL